jgi:hypothetical protein
MWDRLSYINLLMFYGLTCLSFLRISFLWIPIIIDVFFDWLLSFSKLPEYRRRIRIRQYRIDFVFEKKKVKMKVIGLLSLLIVFIPTDRLEIWWWLDMSKRQTGHHIIWEGKVHNTSNCHMGKGEIDSEERSHQIWEGTWYYQLRKLQAGKAEKWLTLGKREVRFRTKDGRR